MIVVVNGKEKEVADGATLLRLLEESGISPDTVVAELNKIIVPSEEFVKTELNDGDHLEILRFVGGG